METYIKYIHKTYKNWSLQAIVLAVAIVVLDNPEDFAEGFSDGFNSTCNNACSD
jgi:hypothetical protein